MIDLESYMAYYQEINLGSPLRQRSSEFETDPRIPRLWACYLLGIPT